MKEKWITLQGKLMDVIILSSLVLIGAMTIIGLFYGIVAAFIYLEEGNQDKWATLKRKQTILRSVLLEVSAAGIVGIFSLNGALLQYLSGEMTVILSFMMTLWGVLLLPLYLMLLHRVANSQKLTVAQVSKDLKVILINFPNWLGQSVYLLILGGVTYLFPALSIMTVGMFLLQTQRLIQRQQAKLLVLQGGHS